MAERMAGRRHGGGRRRLVLFLLVLILAALLGGFLAFARHVDRLDVSAELPKADGIVVWTGKGGGRLETAGQLLADGHGERLLVSGVNRSLSLAKVAELAGLEPQQADCCLDLDFAAEDTRGNALETAAWAEALGYEHIILVTSAYHMPRARVEIGHALGRIRITPVAVQAADRKSWWADGQRFRRLSGEYGKFLLSLARGRQSTRDAIPETAPLPDAD